VVNIEVKFIDIPLKQRGCQPPWAGINMCPGIFAALWPEDAHMPRIMTGEKSELIKKYVFKIRIDLV